VILYTANAGINLDAAPPVKLTRKVQVIKANAVRTAYGVVRAATYRYWPVGTATSSSLERDARDPQILSG
jgi:hypothetical protein